MVARLIEGWESSTTTAHYVGKWTSLTGSVSSTAGRNGQGMRLTGTGSAHFGRTLDAQATWIVGFAFRVATTYPAGTTTILQLLDSATLHCGLGLNTAGQVFAFRTSTSTVLGTITAPLTLGAWTYVECKATIHDTTGSIEVRFNGTPVLTLTGVDTRNAGATATANTVRFGVNATPPNLDYDDVYVFDATGSSNNDFAGDCKVEQVLPTGAGATTAWTPSAGSNWQCVDDAPPNGDTDYVASSTAAQTDTYGCGDLAVATSGAVKTVQATVYARKDDAGSRSLALVARPGSTDRVGATVALGDAFAMVTEIWNTNPDTSAAWTVAQVNASEFGHRLIA